MKICTTQSSSRARPEWIVCNVHYFVYIWTIKRQYNYLNYLLDKLYIQWKLISRILIHISQVSIYIFWLFTIKIERKRTWNIYTLKMHNNTIIIIICNGYKNVSFETEHIQKIKAMVCLRLCSSNIIFSSITKLLFKR